MASVNKLTLIGNLGADPQLRYTEGGQAMCQLRVATQETWKDKQGQQQERTEWHWVVVFGARAEACAKHLAKGRQVYIEGPLQTRSWEKDGQKHYVTEVKAATVLFIGGGEVRGPSQGETSRREASASGARSGKGQQPTPPQPGPDPDEDIPF